MKIYAAAARRRSRQKLACHDAGKQVLLYGPIYINETVEYTRMSHLRGINSHIVIIDLVKSCAIKRIINVYRSFNPQNNVSARTKFTYQLNISIWELKLKNTKGYDRIPQRVIVDGRDFLIKPLTNLFKLIYRDCAILGQWLVIIILYLVCQFHQYKLFCTLLF